MRKIVIDGRSLASGKTNGIVRVNIELLKELDRIVPPGIIEVVIPEGSKSNLTYNNISVIQHGKPRHLLWRQVSFPQYVRSHQAISLNLNNKAPLICPDILCMHDINSVVNPQNYNKTWIKRIFDVDKLSKRIILKHAKKIFVPSEFTKNEIKKYFSCGNRDITVINWGWQHYNDIHADYTCIEKHGLTGKRFFFAMSSLAPHKNFKWVIDVAKKNPDSIFVIAGAADPKVFGDEYTPEKLKAVKYIGYVTDEEAKALMEKCEAFLFPSFYEGFGIPPLEAMSVGTEVIIADIPVLREIFGDSAHYIDPHNSDIDIEGILQSETQLSKQVILNKYSWEKAAEELWEILKEYAG